MPDQQPDVLVKIARVLDFLSVEAMEDMLNQLDRQSDEKGEHVITLLRKQGNMTDHELKTVKLYHKFLAARAKGLRFGEIALRNRKIQEEQFREALTRQKELFSNDNNIVQLPRILVDEGVLNKGQVEKISRVQKKMQE